MPIYEYECLACGRQHEIFVKVNDQPLTKCPDCGGEIKKLVSNTSFVLKGTGWYKTDYAAPKDGKPKKSDKTGEGPTKEKKSEGKAEAASKA